MNLPKTKTRKGQDFLQIKLRGEAMTNLIANAEKEGKTLTQYLTDLINKNTI